MTAEHLPGERDLGFQLIDVPAGPLADRVALILQAVSHLQLPASGRCAC